MYVPSDNPNSQSYACSSMCEYCSFGFQNVSSLDGLTLATASATFKEVDSEFLVTSQMVQSYLRMCKP